MRTTHSEERSIEVNASLSSGPSNCEEGFGGTRELIETSRSSCPVERSCCPVAVCLGGSAGFSRRRLSGGWLRNTDHFIVYMGSCEN